jgi:hypothetical protein
MILRIVVNVFIKASKIVILFFSLTRQPKNVKLAVHGQLLQSVHLCNARPSHLLKKYALIKSF